MEAGNRTRRRSLFPGVGPRRHERGGSRHFGRLDLLAAGKEAARRAGSEEENRGGEEGQNAQCGERAARRIRANRGNERENR